MRISGERDRMTKSKISLAVMEGISTIEQWQNQADSIQVAETMMIAGEIFELDSVRMRYSKILLAQCWGMRAIAAAGLTLSPSSCCVGLYVFGLALVCLPFTKILQSSWYTSTAVVDKEHILVQI